MFLFGKYHFFQKEDKGILRKVIKKINSTLIEFPISSISFELLYWRKDNAIHNWFVTNVQNGVNDCGEYPVSKENFMDLLETINRVLADNTLAKKLLPTLNGCFYGSIDYDSNYFKSLLETKVIIEKILLTKLYEELSIIYTSSY